MIVITVTLALAIAGISFSLGVLLTVAAFLCAIWRDKHPAPDPQVLRPRPQPGAGR